MKKLGIFLLLILPFIVSAQTPDLDFINQLIQEQGTGTSQINADVLNSAILPNESFGNVDPDTGLPFGIEEQISVTVTPQVPQPRERVTISVASYSSNFKSAVVTWRKDGSIVSSGIGKTSYSFLAPDSGDRTTISLTVEKEFGGTLQREFTFAPADVDILWEAQTYTPPFYKGKSLFTRQSSVIFVALPNFVDSTTGNTIPASELVYTWKLNGNVIQDQSGYGQSSFRVAGDVLSRPLTVIVTVTAIGSDLSAKQSLTVTPFDPEVLLYENNPLYGIMFEKALVGNFMINRDEMEISAIPYHFSADSRETNELKYSWLLNGKTINTYDNRNSLVFRRTSDETGTANVGIKTNHITNFLQASDARFSIILEDIGLGGSQSNTSGDTNPNDLEDFAF